MDVSPPDGERVSTETHVNLLHDEEVSVRVGAFDDGFDVADDGTGIPRDS